MEQKISKEQKLEQEVKQWKETCEIVSNPKTMRSIAISLQQIKKGKTKPLSMLKV